MTENRTQMRQQETITGTFLAHPRGFGFVEIKEAEQDLYIPGGRTGGAFHGDTVEAVLLPGRRGRRPEGKVVRIVQRGVRCLVGTYEKRKGGGVCMPDDPNWAAEIVIPPRRAKGAAGGCKVVVEITDYGSDGKKPEGKVTEVLGRSGDPGVDLLSIAKHFEIPTEFPKLAAERAAAVPDGVSEAERAGRRDLRGVYMVTIDGEDARDLDDAVSLTWEDGRYHLGVHIADVAHYVRENSALDREARRRGTSVYLPGSVIPMLPPALSNGICSLNEGQERLALSCLLTLDASGRTLDYEIAESLIRVDRRMTYTQVEAILTDKDDALRRAFAPAVPMLEQMARLAGTLQRLREERGAVDFEFPETKLTLDEAGHPIEIRLYEHNTATRLIENFMLLANETIAQHFYWLDIPFLYRTHAAPDPEKMQSLRLLVRNFGYTIKKKRKGEVHPKEIQMLLRRIADSPEEAMISRLTLRSMQQARYTTVCSGHFGLACPYYCHFTSPIRRYPDLQIHRIIKEQLRGRLSGARLEHYRELLPEVAGHSSETERRAQEAEREAVKLKKAEYMEQRIGMLYEGVISGVTGWGIYVELQNTVEGLVHISALPGDTYWYDAPHCEIAGRETGRRYRLGERLRVRVYAADRRTRTIDFRIAEEEDGEGKSE